MQIGIIYYSAGQPFTLANIYIFILSGKLFYKIEIFDCNQIKTI
jgi:hypothetical protein